MMIGLCVLVIVAVLIRISVMATFAASSIPSDAAVAIECQIEMVDNARNVGKYTSIALDSEGNAHIGYFDDDNNDVKYARQVPAGWEIEVADPGKVYGYTSLALDGADQPHISYYGDVYNALMVAHRDSGVWTLDRVNAISIDYLIGKYSSIAVDSNGYSHVSYYKEYNYRGYLMYAWQDASGWHIQTVETPEFGGRYPGKYTSIALDEAGFPHISYYHDSDWELKYAYKDGSGWHLETADASGQVGKHTSLELDSSGYPHISYFHSSRDDLMYVYKDGSGWHRETVDSDGEVGSDTSLELDGAGYPHISYRDFGANVLKYAYKDASGWHIQTIDSSEYAGYYSSLALDAAGNAHISYRGGGLRYALCEFTGPTPTPTTHWRTVYLPLTKRD